MIPLRDASRTPERFPLVTVSLIAANVLAFVWEVGSDEAAIIRWAVVPAELLSRTRMDHAIHRDVPARRRDAHRQQYGVSRGFRSDGRRRDGPREISRLLSARRTWATAAQIAMGPASTVPQLGASGAIAAVMGAFLVTYPGDRIKVLWFFGIFAHVSQVPAFVLIGLWLISQMLNQMGAVVEADAGGIAYAAHVGGAVFGILTARLFEGGAERRAAPRRAQNA